MLEFQVTPYSVSNWYVDQETKKDVLFLLQILSG